MREYIDAYAVVCVWETYIANSQFCVPRDYRRHKVNFINSLNYAACEKKIQIVHYLSVEASCHSLALHSWVSRAARIYKYSSIP